MTKVKKLLQGEKSAANDLSTLLDWSNFEVCTDNGTLLVSLTVNSALSDLDSYAWLERTGAQMPRGTRLFVAPWKSILAKLEIDPASVDRKKLFSLLEKDLELYETTKSQQRALSFPSIDPGELKSGTKNLHATFGNHAKSNECTIDALAAFYTVDHGGDMDEAKALLRSVINHPSNMNVFSIGAGGAPKVRRLQSATGKQTGLEAFDKTRKPRKSKAD